MRVHCEMCDSLVPADDVHSCFDAALLRQQQEAKKEAERAVIDAAKARVRAEQEYESLRKKGRFARSSARMLSIQHIVRCDEKISAAVANLRKLEGET